LTVALSHIQTPSSLFITLSGQIMNENEARILAAFRVHRSAFAVR
jgi:hypothetical protein